MALSAENQSFTLTLPRELRARIDAYAVELTAGVGLRVSSGAAAVRLIEAALDRIEKERARKR